MHTVLNLRGSIPERIYITDSRWHDSNYLDVIKPNPWAIYTMDKAYLDFEALYKLHKVNYFFITRPKSPLRYEVVGIVGDCVIRLTGYKSKKLYPENLRMVEYLDAESGGVYKSSGCISFERKALLWLIPQMCLKQRNVSC